jgi:hypothetical protein
MAHDVFISYSSRDRSAARAICDALEAAGITCWIAPRDVSIGRQFPGALVEAIPQSRAFLLVFSSSANRSKHVVREVAHAINEDVSVAVVRIEDVLPAGDIEHYIGIIHWFDAFPGELAGYFDELTQKVADLLARVSATEKPALEYAPSTALPQVSVPAASGRPREARDKIESALDHLEQLQHRRLKESRDELERLQIAEKDK